jgi:transposase
MSLTEIRVCVDIGSTKHRVAIGLSDGSILEEFDLAHTAEGFQFFFNSIEANQKKYHLPISVAMEGYNGHARPLDDFCLSKGYRLWNVNNHKLARFKEIFPAAAKSDAIDARKMLELFTLKEHLPMAKDVLQEIMPSPLEHEKLKYLTRRRRVLVNEKIRMINRLQADLNAIAPGLVEITNDVANKWFLNFLSSRSDFKQLLKLRMSSLLKIPGVGKGYAEQVQIWQRHADLSPDVEWVGTMIIRDVKRLLALQQEIKSLVEQMRPLLIASTLAQRLQSIPGFGEVTAAELTGEIGAIERFSDEASLAVYLGMAPLNHSSGKYISAKASRHVNTRAKVAIMAALSKHILLMPDAKKYYEKKRAEGKKHNQAVRAFGRHMVRVMWTMVKQGRDYQNRNFIS